MFYLLILPKSFSLKYLESLNGAKSLLLVQLQKKEIGEEIF